MSATVYKYLEETPLKNAVVHIPYKGYIISISVLKLNETAVFDKDGSAVLFNSYGTDGGNIKEAIDFIDAQTK